MIWKSLRILLVGLIMFGCSGHMISPFHYIQAGGYAPLPLKVIPIWIDKSFGAADKV